MEWYEGITVFGLTLGQIWAFIGPLLAGAIGAVLTRWFRKRDDREARRKEWLAGQLQEAFQLISEAREIPGMDAAAQLECKRKLRDAINRIDLYADAETKAAAGKIVQDFAEQKSWVVYDGLLTALRDKFREAMGLSKIDSPVIGLVIHQTGGPGGLERDQSNDTRVDEG